MIDKRSALIKRNENFVQIPMPNLSNMTDEELEKRANRFDSLFNMGFDGGEDEGEEEDL